MYKLIKWNVIHWKKLWRRLWFRTANIELENNDLEEWTYRLNWLIKWKVLNWVWVYKKNENLFESHFFNFDDEIYWKEIEIMVLYKIRENIKFKSFDELKEQVEKDIESVKKTQDYVLSFWTFDILHPWHNYYLTRSKLYWDKLITIVATDENVLKFKWFDPKNNWLERVKNLKKLWICSTVVIWEGVDPLRWIDLYKPKVICLWYDQKWFSGELKNYIKDNNLDIKIFRIPAFREDIYKSSKMRDNN